MSIEPRVHAAARPRRELTTGLAFLAPNILGFLAFTAVPLVISLMMAFTNWDLKLHNRVRESQLFEAGQPPEPVRFVGLDNFIRLLDWNGDTDFYRYLGNTLFLMMGMPFAIATSLMLAIMLSKDLGGGSRRTWAVLVAGAVLLGSIVLLMIAAAGGTGTTLLMGGFVGALLLAGVAGGTTVYRTLFYVPHFTAGVATYLLWKKLYNPTNGPISAMLDGPLQVIAEVVNATPAWMWVALSWLVLALLIATLARATRRLRSLWIDGDLGSGAAIGSFALIALPMVLALRWASSIRTPIGLGAGPLLCAAAAIVAAIAVVRNISTDRRFTSRGFAGLGTGVMFATTVMVFEMVLIGVAVIVRNLPAWSSDGLQTPNWLTDVSWAKPSLIVMGFWGAIGSNTMLLYLAALTNVPPELYEAADVDGAPRFSKFWNITWPELAPTTFFIVVMGVIGGLQGGFEMARVMTLGGPAGQTTTLSYFIYTEGFETGRLGFSSAIAWTLFFMVILVTLFNWKCGNKYVSE